MPSEQQDASPKIANDMAAIFRQTNAVMAIEGFEKTPTMESLQAAVLAGRATLNEAEAFVLLEAKIAGTRCTLEAISPSDPRFTVIADSLNVHVEQLRAMAISMGGTVRVAHGL